MWIAKAVQISLLLGAVTSLGARQASAQNFHETFEARCMACHGHAGEFARTSLSLSNGKVVGSRGKELGTFLSTHQGGLSPEEIESFLDVFKMQLQSAGFFRERCLTCHGRAYEFTRLNLIMRGGDLMGRYSGLDVQQFLLGHARMSKGEADAMYSALVDIWFGLR